LADYHLDDGEIGVDAITAIRDAAGAAVPAIIITADYSDALQAEAQAADCHVLNKPVRRGKLRSLAAHLLGVRVA
jgi:CheY-like chemotaxis protein